SATASDILRVTKYDSALNVSASDVKIGENATIRINVVPETLRGEAALVINNYNTVIYLEDGLTNVTLSNLDAGTYNVTVLFNGDAKYRPSNATCSFKVLKTHSSLDVEVDYDEKTLKGTVTVRTNPLNCTGTVGVYINYDFYTLNLTDGKAVFNVEYYKGTNYIYVFYDGDYYFDGADWNTTLGMDAEVVLLGKNVTAWQENDFNYTIRLLEDNGIPLPNRIVSISFDGKKYNVTTNDNGFAYFKLNLSVGKYHISAAYKNATVTNTLTVNPIEFNLTANNISYGDVEIFEAAFKDGIHGKVNFVISGVLNVTADIVDGRALFNTSSLKVGSYVLNAYYLNSNKKIKFVINKADLNVTVKADNVGVGFDQIIEVTNLSSATGNIVFIVNGDGHSKQIADSKCCLNLSKLETGTYEMTVKYSGDDNYNNFTITTVFYVKEFYSDIVLNVNDTCYGQNIRIMANLSSNATGFVRFTVGNISKDTKIENGIAECEFKWLDVGNYTVNAEYLGDNLYISSSNSTSFNVLKSNSNIVVYDEGAYLGENIRIFAKLSENATGSVSFSMIGYYSPRGKTISNSQATWYISPLKTGSYTILAEYNGDSNYYASNTTYILNITQKKAVLDVSIDDAGLNDRVIAKISLLSSDGDKLNATILLKINTKSYNVRVLNGASTFVLGKLEENNYTFMATYDGDENFSRSTCEGKFIVVNDLLAVNLTAKNVEMYYKGSEKLQISLLSASGKAISGETVHVTIAGKKYSVITDKNGKASLDLNLASRNYIAYISFNQTARYHSASANASIKVYSTVEGIDLIKIYGSGSQYFAIFCDSNGKVLANTKVKFTIGKNSITTTTLPNGISRLNINLKCGTYTITAINPVTGEKAKNTIKIFKRLAGNKNVVQYYGANKYYKVRAYGDNGKAVGAGVVVKIKINGKSYKVKTNKNGYALFKIKLKPKKYTITATYKGYKVTNKVTVKSTIITKNLSKKKSRSGIFKAKLVNKNGKILKGKKITFKFYGKKYVVKTNRYGLAGIVLKSSLKVGKYNIVTSYGKLSVKNTIVIK
ncbi:Ig-like domain-containing protein, partial [Methanobrevibacter sp.]|uniref:Ig-like domain-containing protein n=1 Tax=Methanobrevibacter sp. TaxID=66852 RepID=UPI0026E0AEA1